ADIKARHHFESPGLLAVRHARQARLAELFMATAESLRSEFSRQQGSGFRLTAQADELGKEPALRENLVLHDVQHAVGALRRLEVHICGSKLAPDADYFT